MATTSTTEISKRGVGGRSVDDLRSGSKDAREVKTMEMEEGVRLDYFREYQPTISERAFGLKACLNTSETETNSDENKSQEIHEPCLASHSEPIPREGIFRKRLPQDTDPEKAMVDVDIQQAHSNSELKKTRKTRFPEPQKDSKHPSIVVMRNTSTDNTPNLTLNVPNSVLRRELYGVAICGSILQLGVLVYDGFATYYPTLRLLKDRKPVSDYAFPCTAAGTLLLIAGMLVCAYIVESSTSERIYRPAAGKARVVWLQRASIANDQAFAILPPQGNDLVTTSHRAGSQKDERNQARAAKLTVIGALVSICGFILQFTGLRGMHWSASIAQLGATGIMTILRSVVRRNLAQPPKAKHIVSGHELDWLAMILGDCTKSTWLDMSEEGGKEHKIPYDWKLVAVDDPSKCEKLEPDKSVTATKSDRPIDLPFAHKVMMIRKDLGKLADWSGPASAEAIALARAIEVAMNALFEHPTRTFTWCLKTCGGEFIRFNLEKEPTGNWKACSDEIEAALSLWLYSVYDQEKSGENEKKTNGQQMDGKDNGRSRTKDTPVKRGLRLLGSNTITLQRDLRWWLPDGAIRVVEVKQADEDVTDYKAVEVETYRIVGHASARNSCSPAETCTHRYKTREFPELLSEVAPSHQVQDRETLFAVESYSPLKLLYAQHMFSSFMLAAAKTMDDPICGGATIRPTDTESHGATWTSFGLHNSQLSKLAQNVKNTGLGTLEDIYLSIVPPLSAENKLPRADAIIEWAREHAVPHEHLCHWKETSEAYLWLFRIGMSFPVEDVIYGSATALLMEFSRAVATTAGLRRSQQLESRAIEELEKLQSSLYDHLDTAAGSTLLYLARLFEVQKRGWSYTERILDVQRRERPDDPVTKDISLCDEDISFPANFKHTDLHKYAHCRNWWNIDKKVDEKDADINEKDILGWTPLHYASTVCSQRTVKKLLSRRADANARDLRGWTPLHYACWHDNPISVLDLLREGADINIRGIDGIAPVHYAAFHGSLSVLRSFIEAGADINVVDCLGKTPLLWAAYMAWEPVVQELWRDTTSKVRDYNGRTPLHLAAIAAGLPERREAVTRRIVSLRANKNAKDRHGRTPKDLAHKAGYDDIAKQLCESPADTAVPIISP